MRRQGESPAAAAEESAGPSRDQKVGAALAEALAIVEHGRQRETRRALARAMTREPAMAEPWLRAQVAQLAAS